MLLTHHSMKLFMRGKLIAKHFGAQHMSRRDLKALTDTALTTLYRKAIPGIDN